MRRIVAPDAAPVHNNRGNALRELGRHDDALAAFDRALALKPDYAEAHNNRGNTLLELNRRPRRSPVTSARWRSSPTSSMHWSIAAMRCAISAAQQRSDRKLRRRIALNPQLAEAHWNKGLSLLVARRFRARLAATSGAGSAAQRAHAARFRAAAMARRGLAGKTILLHAEQGFGDSIQFIRYLPLVAAKGAR